MTGNGQPNGPEQPSGHGTGTDWPPTQSDVSPIGGQRQAVAGPQPQVQRQRYGRGQMR